MLGIVNSHNGFINVYSEAGQGTKFTIFLPANITEQTAQPTAKGAEMPAGHGKLILMIDDEASVREITRSTLETFGYRVLTASAGTETETLTVYAQHGSEICARLADMMMPYMDDPTTIRAMQTLNPQIKFIASSRLANSTETCRAKLSFIPSPKFSRISPLIFRYASLDCGAIGREEYELSH